MRELTRREYIACFGTVDDKLLRKKVAMWNEMNPQQGIIKTTVRRATGTIMIYREELPKYFADILHENETKHGIVYVEGFCRWKWAKERAA